MPPRLQSHKTLNMAQPGPQGHRSRHSRNISTVMSGPGLMDAAPRIEMVPNPDFAFPRRPHTALPLREEPSAANCGPRPMSMQDQRPRTAGVAHRKTASTLPAFSFNAADVSGLQAESSPPHTPNELTIPVEYTELDSTSAPVTPARHRRTNSEFVGGDSRLGVAKAISSSPTKALHPASSDKPFNHRHRRSVAVSSHDLSNIMSPAEPEPRLSISLPATPLEPMLPSPGAGSSDESVSANNDVADPFGPAITDSPDRPPSRPRVGFSDNVEYIPRPLSTISSGTESSISTVRGHSVNNSISSVLSLGTPSPPSTRARARTLETTFEDEPRSKARSSLEISKRVEKEGEWLRSVTSSPVPDRPCTEPADRPAKISFAPDDTPARLRSSSMATRGMDTDRRRSETAIGMYADEPTRHSALSLQESDLRRPLSEHSGVYIAGRKQSKQKARINWKGWAKSKMSRKTKETMRDYPIESASASSVELTSSENPSEISVPGFVQFGDAAVAETDLDAVLSSQASPVQNQVGFSQVDFHAPVQTQKPASRPRDSDEYTYMLDLDAALGPFKTPQPLSPPLQHRPIREMHSSRLAKDFTGPGGHYYPEPVHRRTKSTPTGKLDQALYAPGLERMHDVFEEDEEEDEENAFPKDVRPSSTQSNLDDENSIGVQIVDSDPSVASSSSSLGLDTDLRMSQGSWDLERPVVSYGPVSSHLSTPIMERRASSLIEETIFEESSPVEPVEIVQAYEEPRAPSLTKSSDSSETPTVLGGTPGTLSLSDGPQSVSTSETYQTSTFSSPDFARRQGSFDNSRVGTSASSIADSRTMSSYTTGEPTPDVRMSVDDVPSLTSSRSTMLSTLQANLSRRDVCGSRPLSAHSNSLDAAVASEERRRKRSSIQSLSQLMGGPFGPRSSATDDARPHTASDAATAKGLRKKDNRLKKLMFWKSKHRQASSSTTMTT